MKILFTHLLIVAFFSCQQKEMNSLIRSDFSMSYPNYLELDETGIDGSVFILKNDSKDEENIFIESINLVVQENKITNLEKYSFDVKNGIEKMGGKILKSSIDKIHGKNRFRMILEFTSNDVDLKFIQDYIIDSDKVYLLTFTCLKSEFSNYYKEINEALSSFKLAKKDLVKSNRI